MEIHGKKIRATTRQVISRDVDKVTCSSPLIFILFYFILFFTFYDWNIKRPGCRSEFKKSEISATPALSGLQKKLEI